MGKVTIGFSMSLDGFVAGLNDGVDKPLGEGGANLFKWYSLGAPAQKNLEEGVRLKLSKEETAKLKDSSRMVGALVYGRRTFDISHAWDGKHPLDVPMVIITHHIPQEWVKPGSPFTFVTDGVENAIRKAKAIAGEKAVALGSASIVQQGIQLGLVDEIHIDLVPVLLGGGVRLFEKLGKVPIELEITNMEEGLGVTHLDYRIVK